jgi:hypothetical protein
MRLHLTHSPRLKFSFVAKALCVGLLAVGGPLSARGQSPPAAPLPPPTQSPTPIQIPATTAPGSRTPRNESTAMIETRISQLDAILLTPTAKPGDVLQSIDAIDSALSTLPVVAAPLGKAGDLTEGLGRKTLQPPTQAQAHTGNDKPMPPTVEDRSFETMETHRPAGLERRQALATARAELSKLRRGAATGLTRTALLKRWQKLKPTLTRLY